MSLEDSPSLEDFKNGLPQKLPDPNAKRKRVRMLAGVLMVAVIGLGILNFLNSDLSASIAGQGAVRGKIENEMGQGLTADVFVSGTKILTRSQTDGQFELRGINAGDQVITVGYMFAGHTYPVTIHAGKTADMGVISIPTTPREANVPNPRLEWR